jgi:hypothetical protein
MNPKRILIIGLEDTEVEAIKANTQAWLVSYNMLPNIQLVAGRLWVESAKIPDKYLEVDKVIYHGIFENDFDLITLLALWGGECLPNAQGMMDCRLRHSGLVRALNITKFGNLPRGMSIHSQVWHSESEVVAKWGNWHCGENKHRFQGDWQTTEATVFEPFIKGEAVRIMMVGEKSWQIRLTGDDWLKSIHHSDSGEMPIDHELLEDTQNLARYFNFDIVGVDYMVAENGEKYLLEVNHIPNVTVFSFVKEAFISFASAWCNQ